jgi:hypothetical protein
VIVALVKDEVLWTINSLEILGIIYLAIAVSKLRERLANLQGQYDQRERNGIRSDAKRTDANGG